MYYVLCIMFYVLCEVLRPTKIIIINYKQVSF